MTALFKKWRGWLDRIEQEQLEDLLINQFIFQQLRESTAPYVGKREGAELSRWMVQNYIAFAATAIRLMTERPSKKYRSVSLRIILEDMAAHDYLLTRQRYCRLYRNAMVRQRFADRDFNKIARNKRASHVTAGRIRRDIKAIDSACAPVARLVNKVVAHTEFDRRKVGRIRYVQIDRAIDLLETTFTRYSQLVNGRAHNPREPLETFDLRGDFKRLWP